MFIKFLHHLQQVSLSFFFKLFFLFLNSSETLSKCIRINVNIPEAILFMYFILEYIYYYFIFFQSDGLQSSIPSESNTNKHPGSYITLPLCVYAASKNVTLNDIIWWYFFFTTKCPCNVNFVTSIYHLSSILYRNKITKKKKYLFMRILNCNKFRKQIFNK